MLRARQQKVLDNEVSHHRLLELRIQLAFWILELVDRIPPAFVPALQEIKPIFHTQLSQLVAWLYQLLVVSCIPPSQLPVLFV